MPYVPAGQKNLGNLIPKYPSRRDAIFPVKFTLSGIPCGLSNALHSLRVQRYIVLRYTAIRKVYDTYRDTQPNDTHNDTAGVLLVGFRIKCLRNFKELKMIQN